jgi:hypothetical protein
MDETALDRMRKRLAAAQAARTTNARLEAALERSRAQMETLANAAAELELTLPDRIGTAVHEGLRREVLPVGRNLAEIRGLLNQVLRRLERIEQELLAERHARIDDLGLLVDLVASSWRGVDERLRRLEHGSAPVIPLRSDPQSEQPEPNGANRAVVAGYQS